MNNYLQFPDSGTDDHAASRRNSVNLDMMQSALIAHSGPPSVAASSVHGGDSASVATAAAASSVDLIQSAVDLVSQGWDSVQILSVLPMYPTVLNSFVKIIYSRKEDSVDAHSVNVLIVLNPAPVVGAAQRCKRGSALRGWQPRVRASQCRQQHSRSPTPHSPGMRFNDSRY